MIAARRHSLENKSMPHPIPQPSSLVVEIKEVAPKNELETLSSQAVFTEDPLPEELLFEDSNNFIIDLPYIGYQDDTYACRKLLSQTILTIGVIKKTKENIYNQIEDAKKHLTEVYARNLNPIKHTKTTENADLWRKRVIVFWKQTKYVKKINLAKLENCYKYLSELNKLERICNEMIKRPRNIFINQNEISRIITVLKNGIETKRLIRLKALDLLESEIKSELRYFPRPFSTVESTVQVLKTVLETSMHCIDPLTGYLPTTVETNIFSDLVNSRFSPIKYNEKQQPETIERLIVMTVKALKIFAEIKDKKYNKLLLFMSARYWFDRQLVCNEFYKERDPLIVFYIQSIRNNPISCFKPPKAFIKIDKKYLDMTPVEFFSREKILALAFDSLFVLSFYTSPAEIAYDIHLLDLRLSGYIATLTKKDINDKSTLECTAFLWKLLLIAAEMPFPDVLFEFVAKYSAIAEIPATLMKKVKIPLEIMRQLLNDMRKSHFSL